MSDSTASIVPAAFPPSAPAFAPYTCNAASSDSLIEALSRGWVELDGAILRKLRLSRFMSQQDLANDCWHRDIRVSIATIKRAECGHAVRFRIAREFARCFYVPVASLVRY